MCVAAEIRKGHLPNTTLNRRSSSDVTRRSKQFKNRWRYLECDTGSLFQYIVYSVLFVSHQV
jgi:hypothetical protein